MGFVDSLLCVFGKNCGKTVPPTTTNVVSKLQANIGVECSPNLTLVQNTLCPVVLEKCNKVSVRCENNAVQSVTCSLDEMVKSGLAALESVDPDVLIKTLNLAKGATKNDIENALRLRIQETCNSSATSVQNIIGGLLCEESNNVTLDFIASMDQSMGCAAAVIASVGAETVKNKTNEDKATGIAIVVTFAIVYILILVGIVLAIRG